VYLIFKVSLRMSVLVWWFNYDPRFSVAGWQRWSSGVQKYPGWSNILGWGLVWPILPVRLHKNQLLLHLDHRAISNATN